MTEAKKPKTLGEFLGVHGEVERVARLADQANPGKDYPTAVYSKADGDLRVLAYEQARQLPHFDSATCPNPSALSDQEVSAYINAYLSSKAIEASNVVSRPGALEEIVGELDQSGKLKNAERIEDIAQPYKMEVQKQAQTTARKMYDTIMATRKDKRIASLMQSAVLATYEAGHAKLPGIKDVVRNVLGVMVKEDPSKAKSIISALAK